MKILLVRMYKSMLNINVIDFDNSDIIHPYFKNKSKCFELKDVIIKMSGDRLCLYHDNKRLNGFVNRNFNNGDTLHWHGEKEPNLYYGEDKPDLNVEEVIDDLFLIYDDYEWQYAHFVMDCMPKLWYWIKLIGMNRFVKIGLNDIVSPCYTSDLSEKVNYPTSFSTEYIDLYLKRYNLNFNDHVVKIKRDVVYHVKNLILPIPFQSVDTSIYPHRFWEMYDIIGRDINVSDDYQNVYISRKDVSSKKWMHYRVLLNEDEVINNLTNIGFKEIRLIDHSVENKIKIFKSAKKIVQTVGSNCYNLCFINKDTSCGIIYHPQYACWSEHLKNIILYKKSLYFEYKDGCETVANYKEYYPDNYPEIKKKIDAPWEFKNINKLLTDMR